MNSKTNVEIKGRFELKVKSYNTKKGAEAPLIHLVYLTNRLVVCFIW